MTTKKPKQCETTGINAGLIRKAVKHWGKESKPFVIPGVDEQYAPSMTGVIAAATLSYVGSLPPPPAYGTPEYYRCINDWYRCYMQASYLDQYRVQMAQLQQQITNGEIMLTGYLEGYAQCIGGFPA